MFSSMTSLHLMCNPRSIFSYISIQLDVINAWLIFDLN